MPAQGRPKAIPQTGRRAGSTQQVDNSDGGRRSRSNGLQLTRVGIWYLAALVVVVVAATNTGNNGLFLVTAMMASSLIVVQVVAAINVSGLEVEVEPGGEIFANRPTHLTFTARNRSRWLPRWLIVVSVHLDGPEGIGSSSRSRSLPWLIPFLPPGGEVKGHGELMLRFRGPRSIRAIQVSSLFPLGLFHKGRRHKEKQREKIELLVYPEIFHGSATRPQSSGASGDETARIAGWGHELYALRSYRVGDDPRGIHWKQSARQDRLIFQQRAVEESRRLRIILDNAVGELAEGAERKRFERLVSEAATAALDFLAQGYEVSLTTRDEHLPFSTGVRQRRNILETLAWVDPVREENQPLSPGDSRWDHLRLAMDRVEITPDMSAPGVSASASAGGRPRGGAPPGGTPPGGTPPGGAPPGGTPPGGAPSGRATRRGAA